MQIGRDSFFGQLFLVFLVVMLTVNLVLYFYVLSIIKSYVYSVESRSIEKVCVVMKADIDDNVRGSLGADELALKHLSAALDYHTWLTDGRGTVIFASSAGDGSPAADLVRKALAQGRASAVTSDPAKRFFLTVAYPVRLPGVGAGALVVNSPIVGINTAVQDMARTVFVRGALVILVSILVSYYLTRKLTMPIKRLIGGTREVARGRFEKIDVGNTRNELRELGISFNEMIEKLAHLDEEKKKLDTLKQDFLSDLSHELRTPLTTLQAFLEALRDGMVTDEGKKEEYMAALWEETMHLKRLAADLLQLARIESGHLVVERVFFDPLAAIRRVVQNRLQAAGEKGDRLVLSAPGAVPSLWSDPAHFRQIVANLINNAIQFTAGGTITVEARVEGQFLAVAVADTGVGIAPEDMPFIWERFFKVDRARSRQHQESGLGLSIVKKLVELHHGTITVESRPGEGSRFCFVLPLTDPVPGVS